MSKDRVTITGIAYWARLSTPNPTDEKYGLDLIVSEGDADKLIKLGAKPAKDQEGNLKGYEDHPGKVFKFKSRSINTVTGQAVPPPVVVDSHLQPIASLVGNGSQVVVSGTVYHWEFKGRKGVSLQLLGVQVLDLVEFNSRSAESLGFKAVEGDATDEI